MVEFEIADITFANDLVEFWKESFLAAYGDIHKKSNIEIYFEKSYSLYVAQNILKSQKFICLKVKRDAKLVGITIINHEKCPLKAELKASELKQLYLHPSEYGSGLAKSIMDKVMEMIKESGDRYIWLSVSKLNRRAQRFYLKMNFEVIGDGEDIHVGEEVLPSLIMIRKVN